VFVNVYYFLLLLLLHLLVLLLLRRKRISTLEIIVRKKTRKVKMKGRKEGREGERKGGRGEREGGRREEREEKKTNMLILIKARRRRRRRRNRRRRRKRIPTLEIIDRKETRKEKMKRNKHVDVDQGPSLPPPPPCRPPPFHLSFHPAFCRCPRDLCPPPSYFFPSCHPRPVGPRLSPIKSIVRKEK